MQLHFNSSRWGNSTFFSGIKNDEIKIFGTDSLACFNGYIKELLQCELEYVQETYSIVSNQTRN